MIIIFDILDGAPPPPPKKNVLVNLRNLIKDLHIILPEFMLVNPIHL